MPLLRANRKAAIAKQVSFSVFTRADTSLIRRENFEGTEHLIVPLVALVEGVIWSSNSAHPELALATEFGKQPLAWNGRPVTLGHPMKNGVYVSASQSPDVFEKESLGFLFNTTLDGKKLKTEAWINLSKVEKAGEEVSKQIERLESGDTVEVSTGLFAVRENVEGKFDGETYEGVWREVLPDHLAILREGEIGACSVADGCGAPRVNSHQYKSLSEPCTCEGECDECKHEAEEIQGVTKFLKSLKDRFSGAFTLNAAGEELSDADTRTALRSALSAEDKAGMFDVIAVFAEKFVYTDWWDGILLERNYKIGNEGIVSLGSNKTPVRPVTDFVPIKVDITSEEETEMSKAEKVKALIANKATKFSENDQSWLETLSEEQLDKLEPVQEPAKEETTEGDGSEEGEGTDETTEGGAATKPTTPEEFIQQAPEEMQEVLNSGLLMHRKEKETLVKKLVANKKCEYSDKELRAMKLGDLQKLAKLSGEHNYAGQAGATPVVNSADEIPEAPKAFTYNSASSGK